MQPSGAAHDVVVWQGAAVGVVGLACLEPEQVRAIALIDQQHRLARSERSTWRPG